jgi:hypothetical protein
LRLLIYLINCTYCYGQSDTTTEMPWAQFIDIGYRIGLIDKEAKEILVVGENIRKINIDIVSGEQDTIVFRKVVKYVFDNLIPFQIKFSEIDRMEIIRKYLQRRDSEEIINDGV